MTTTTTSAPIATTAPTAVRVGTTARPVASAAQPFVTGYFKSAYGDMVFREVNGQVRAVYDYRGGTIVGGVGADGVFRGWWTQTPKRAPDADAGEVEFTFKSPTHADGSWRYGTTGSLRNNWTLDRAQGEPPAALVARFNDEATFKSHP